MIVKCWSIYEVHQ